MYAIDQVAQDATAFRVSYARAEGYRPLYVKLKLLWGCNLRCVMCNHWRDARPHQLSTAQLLALLEELAGLGCRKIHLTGGEPALRPDLEQLVAASTQLGIRATMTTNATLLTRDRARRLVAGGLRNVNVSIDSPDPATHDEVRGDPGSWERALTGMKHLRKERRHGKLSLAINTVVSSRNFRTLTELPRLALRVGATALRLLPVDEHTGVSLRLSPDQIQEWNRDLAPVLLLHARRAGLMRNAGEAYPFGRGQDEERESAGGRYARGYYQKRPCLAPYTHALVDHEGDVHVCCMARGNGPKLGNLHAQSFTEIWNGLAYQRVRQSMHGPEKLAACARCDDFIGENRRFHRILNGVA